MSDSEPQLLTDFNASLKGGRKTKKHGKRHGNASLRSWVTFVKKVAKEENLSYRDAMMRAKARKDKGEKWMKGGDMTGTDVVPASGSQVVPDPDPADPAGSYADTDTNSEYLGVREGGRRRRRSGRKTHRKKSHKKRRGSRRR